MQKSSKFLVLGSWQMFYLRELWDTEKHICHPEILLLFPQLMHGHPFTIPCFYLNPRKTAWIRNSNQTAWNCLFPLGGCSCSCRQCWGLYSWDCWLEEAGAGGFRMGRGWARGARTVISLYCSTNQAPEASGLNQIPSAGQCVEELGIRPTLAEILGYCSELEVGVGSGWVKE